MNVQCQFETTAAVFGKEALIVVFDKNARFRRSTSVVTSEIASETVVVPKEDEVPDRNVVFSFNAIGADVWRLIEENRSLAELTSWVLGRYEVSRSRAEADIREFLSELIQAGLATVEQVPYLGARTGHSAHARN